MALAGLAALALAGSAGALQAAGTDPLARTAGAIGLVLLPEVLGPGGCAPFTPKDLPVQSLPDRIGRSLLTLHAAPAAPAQPAGGCAPARARVSPQGSRNGPELPTIEASYDQPAAIVLERRQRWYRIALPADSGWIRIEDSRRFIPLTQLLSGGMAYLRRGALLPLAAEPGRPVAGPARTLDEDVPARVVSTRTLDGILWLQVDTRGAQACGTPAVATLAGWVPLHDQRRQGVPSVWFHPRGC